MANELNFNSLKLALKSIEEGFATQPKTELEKGGIIQRFEYTFELCWKSIRKLLIEMGRQDVSSNFRPLFRDALEENLIDDIMVLFYCSSKNLTFTRNTKRLIYHLKLT